jgi:hypothetical protein
MSQPTPNRPSAGGEIDSRLEKLDRRLRAVQDELMPEREARPVRVAEAAAPPPPPGPAPPPPPPAAALPPPATVTAVHSKLITSLRELLDAYETLLIHFPAPDPPRRDRTEPAVPQSISAGPFPSVEAVRAFRDELASLPGVETVSVGAYEGEDRAIFDVKLTEPRLPDASA